MTQHPARQGRSPFRGMVLGSVASGSAGAVLTAGVLGAARGGDGLVAALLGGATALVILVVGLLGIGAIVAGHPSISMAGAFVVYLGQLILLAAVVLALRDAAWLDGRAFAIGAVVTTVLAQVGLVLGYTRARHVIFPDAGEVTR
ncbi:hypothetical protein P0Y31_17085 [Knoellia sp. 3-2P3]|uniref:hypothetical protein n=1 Tax=unclassified Knoellia TaxID=2618719 RepID=UPI0023DB98BA|nr:hypothetical protein [Knoellia sp. 3-2P3]MDF2094067.1 hypothetical protein [Knoellia sp. 3-2P3]